MALKVLVKQLEEEQRKVWRLEVKLMKAKETIRVMRRKWNRRSK